jgi:hypothetical protein
MGKSGFTGVLWVLSACVLGACGASDTDADTSGADITQAGTDTISEKHEDFGPLRFRDIFFTYAKGTPLEKNFDRLVYLTGDHVRAPQVSVSGASPEATIAALDKSYVGIKPSSIFDLGVKTPPRAIDDIERVFDQGPVTLVLIPGVFSEYNTKTAFEELLTTPNTAAALEWQAHLDAASPSDKTDDGFTLGDLGTTAHPMSELMQVGSIDGADKKPLVTLVFLKPRSGSCETFGTLEANNDVYLKRLDKYFSIMGGAPEHFYMLGWSRGAAVSLDLAARARAEAADHPWASHLGGVVGLGGVIYGTPLADAKDDPNSTTFKLVEGLKKLSSDMIDCDDNESVISRTAKVTQNIASFVADTAKLLALEATAPKHPELGFEGNPTTLPEIGAFNRSLMQMILPGAIPLDKPVSEYCGNVTRLKTLIAHAVEAADTLTTKSRMEWWKTHTLPADMKLFAIASTMGDASASKSQVWPEVNNTAAYNLGSLDHKMLRGNYYDLLPLTHMELNDSQVPMTRGRFWPEMFAALGPGKPAPQTYFLGSLGTHHWGFAFAGAVDTIDASGKLVPDNPFPRTTLVKALGTFVAQAERQGR